ncbi:hypothetical protein LIER_29999 [Lithospermum erythrorhizon]|uniref:Reverse transcriptase domain-containing protein n=1 Tax=Lithospermum erythrorhizon TaxID=34254 RepID=A0AAV3RP46_LITER
MNRQLTRIVISEEVKRVVFEMPADKTLGPDGMMVLFFQSFWHIVSIDIVRAVDSFFFSSRLLNFVNHTHVCFIPKKTSPMSMSDYRPISLCNIIAKIIGRVMTNRLRGFLVSIISETQSAFLSGRIISDHILIAHELLHYMKHKVAGNNHFMSLKLDMSKAYDRIEWKFLESIILKLGFYLTWVDWTMCLVSSVFYSFLVNGAPRGSLG